MEYYDKIYNKLRSEEAVQKQIKAAKLLEASQPSKLRQIFCCAKKIKSLRPTEIVPLVYSSGESGEDENRLGRNYLKMKEAEKDQHVRKLWKRMLAKLKGAIGVINRFRQLSRRIYLFGTSKKLKFEIEREQVIKWYIILPYSRLRTIWNMIILLLLLYTATLVPYRTAFLDNDDWEQNYFLLVFDIFVDFLYFMDLFLNFFMAYEDRDKKLEVRLKKIAGNYLRSWFLPDLLSCIPF